MKILGEDSKVRQGRIQVNKLFYHADYHFGQLRLSYAEDL